MNRYNKYGVLLKPAEENFFYRLATAWGPQPENGSSDSALADKNRQLWNRWWWAWLQARPHALSQEAVAVLNERTRPWDKRALDPEEIAKLETRMQGLPGEPPSLKPEEANPDDIDFSNLIFDCHLLCENFIFPLSLWCHHSHLEKTVSFFNATFLGFVSFIDTIFTEETDFENARFARNASFEEDTRFEKNVSFSGAHFKGSAMFCANFDADLNFTKATFDDIFNFYSNVIGSANFANTTFKEVAAFNGTTFGGRVTLDDVIFMGDAHFDRSTFKKDATFDGTKFQKHAHFDGTNFEGLANFSNTIFQHDARFDKVTFNKRALFDRIRFERDWYLTQTVWNKTSSIVSAYQTTITGKADFSFDPKQRSHEGINANSLDLRKADFQRGLDLTGRRFGSAPQLPGMTLDSDLRVDFDEQAWPLATKGASLEAQHDTYEHLRAIMGKQGRRGAELFFLHREYQSRLHALCQNGTIKWKLFSLLWWYQFVSDFGYSLLRPFIGLLMFCVIALIGYWGLFSFIQVTGAYHLNIPQSALQQGVQQQDATKQNTDRYATNSEEAMLIVHLAASGILTILPPPSFTVERGDHWAHGGVLLVHTLQRLISALFWFLFGLALRNRLRMP